MVLFKGRMPLGLISFVEHTKLHMPTTYFFDIPIYWCTRTNFNDEYDRKLVQHLSDCEKRAGYSLTADIRLTLTVDFQRNYIAPWNYNQIVGWIRLCRLGSQLRGELWFMNAKRPGRRVIKKQYSFQDKAFELHAWPELTSSDIFQSICQELRSYVKDSPRRMFLDLETFENIGQFVDWRHLMDTPSRT